MHVVAVAADCLAFSPHAVGAGVWGVVLQGDPGTSTVLVDLRAGAVELLAATSRRNRLKSYNGLLDLVPS